VDEGARDAFARHGLMTLLGAELMEVGDGRCVIELLQSDGVTQHHGYFHAGAIGAVLDTAGGFAASSTQGWTDDVLTVEYKLNLLRPGVGERLRAEASVLRAGKQLVVCRGEAYAGDKLCAAMQQTIMFGSPGAPGRTP
jgi:uncharacterized protein (TIGR00369 family)